MGRAIADYWETKPADRLRVLSPMFEEDENSCRLFPQIWEKKSQKF